MRPARREETAQREGPSPAGLVHFAAVARCFHLRNHLRRTRGLSTGLYGRAEVRATLDAVKLPAGD